MLHVPAFPPSWYGDGPEPTEAQQRDEEMLDAVGLYRCVGCGKTLKQGVNHDQEDCELVLEAQS